MLYTVLFGTVTILDMIIVLAIFFGAIMIAKLITLNVRRSFKESASDDQLDMVGKVVYLVATLVALMFVIPILGFNPAGLLVAGGFFALAIGFASQSVISNLLSGVLLMIERPVKIGEVAEIDGVTGTVEQVRIISTHIRTFNGVFVRIPNEKVFTNKITNYLSQPARRWSYAIGIRYVDDADKAVDIIKKLLDEHPLIFESPGPSVYVDNLGDNSVNLIVKMWAPATNWWGVRTEMLWKLKQELESNGIEIPFPQREIWFNNELPTGK